MSDYLHVMQVADTFIKNNGIQDTHYQFLLSMGIKPMTLALIYTGATGII